MDCQPKVIPEVQKTLSQAQAVPLFGFMFVSPIKLVIGLVEMMTGVSFALGFGTLCLMSQLLGRDHQSMDPFTSSGLAHAALGLTSAAYAFCNMATLGVAGFVLEDPRK